MNTLFDNYIVLLNKVNSKSNMFQYKWKIAQRRRKHCALADPQTITQTDRGDYNTLRSLARSVNIYINNRPHNSQHITVVNGLQVMPLSMNDG